MRSLPCPRLALAPLLLLAGPPAAAGQAPLAALRPQVQERIAQHKGKVGLTVIDLKSGETLSIGGAEPYPTASVIKIAILVEAFQQIEKGKLRLEDPISLVEADKVPGAGILQFLSVPHALTVRDAATLMIILSDNTATNLLVDKLGILAVNARMDTLGFRTTRLHAEVFRSRTTSIDPAASAKWGLGVTTPDEMARLFALLYRGEAVSAAASKQMIEILKRQFSSDRLPRLLPPGLEIAHKTGEVDESRHDCGIVYAKQPDYVFCAFTHENADRSWRPDNEALLLIADLARRVHQHLVPAPPPPPARQPGG